jgi:hypothetical protein
MMSNSIESAESLMARLRNLEQWRQDVSKATPSSPLLNLQGLTPERVEQIKSIALAFYDAEIAVARARVAFLGGEAA